MHIVRHTIWIDRPRSQVFDFFIDLSRGHTWRQYVASMTLKSEPPLRAGSLVHVTLDLMGQLYTFTLEVLAFEPPRRWRHRTQEPDFAGYVEYLSGEEKGGTRVHRSG